MQPLIYATKVMDKSNVYRRGIPMHIILKYLNAFLFFYFLLTFVIIIQSRHPIHIQTHTVSLHFTHVHTRTHTHMVFGYCWIRADGGAPYSSKLSDTLTIWHSVSTLFFFSSLSLSNLVTLELRENLLKSLPSWVFSHQTAVIRSTVLLWLYTPKNV